MKQKFSSALSLALIMAMLFTSVGLASDVDVTSVVDVTAPTGSVTLAPGGSGPITINIRVSGSQAGTATFEVYRDWVLSGGTFTGSNSQEFTVGPRSGGDAPNIFSTSGTVTVDGSQPPGGPFTLVVSAFDITNSNSTGAKLGDGADGTYSVNVSVPVVQNQAINVTQAAPASATYGSSFNVSATGGGSGNPVVIAASGSCNGGGNGSALITMTSGIGTCTITYNQAGSTGYNAATQVSSSTAAQKADAAVVVNGFIGPYDGAAHGASGSATGVGGADLTASLTLGASFTDVPGGTANWSFSGGDNYLDENGSVSITITQVSSSTLVTFEAGPYVYRGSAFTATAAVTGVNLNQPVSVGYSGDCTNVTVADGCSATATFAGDTNHTGSTDTKSITITKAPVIATAGSGSSTYDGNAKSPSECNVSGYYQGDLTCANNPSSVGPNAGTYTISPVVSGTGLDNFAIQEVNGSFTISKADADCDVTGYTGTYDGEAHGATGTCTGVNGEDLSAGLNLGVSFTDYPGGVAHWTFSGGTNYEDESGDVNITINKAPVTATAGSGSSTYDGIAKTPSACVVSGDYTGDLACANDQASVGPDAGSYTIQPVVSGTGLSNFEITLFNGSFEIAKAPVTATAGSGSGTYTGSAQSPAACAVSGDYTGDLTCVNNPSSVGPNAGNYAIAPVVSGTGLDNYEITPANGSYTINQADAMIAISGFTGYYDGASHCATGSATGVQGEDLSAGLNLGACFTNVPGGTANWTFSGGTNYEDAQGSVAIVINAWTFGGFYQPVDMDKLNTVKGGSTVPLKFEVFAGPTELTTTAVVKSFVQTRITCDTNALIDEIEVTSTGGTSLRYDATAGQFIQNWQTPRQAGACYRVTMTTLDGSTLSALFKLK